MDKVKDTGLSLRVENTVLKHAEDRRVGDAAPSGETSGECGPAKNVSPMCKEIRGKPSPKTGHE